MPTFVQFSLFFSMTYRIVGDTLSQHSFHLFSDSIPELDVLAPRVHPRTILTHSEVPDGET